MNTGKHREKVGGWGWGWEQGDRIMDRDRDSEILSKESALCVGSDRSEQGGWLSQCPGREGVETADCVTARRAGAGKKVQYGYGGGG